MNKSFWLTGQEFVEFSLQYHQGLKDGYIHAKAFFQNGARHVENERCSQGHRDDKPWSYKLGHREGWRAYLKDHGELLGEERANADILHESLVSA